MISPELRRRWEAFRNNLSAGDRDNLFQPYRDHGERREMPRNWTPDTRGFRSSPAQSIDWEQHRDRWSASFTHKGFLIEVTRAFDEDLDLSFLGALTSKDPFPSRAPPRPSWDWAQQNKHPKACRGNPRRHAWMLGIYDREKEGLRRRNEYEYGVLEYYNYDEERRGFWLQGYSKAEADLMARRAFRQRRRQFEDTASGQILSYYISVDAHFPGDSRVLGQASIGGVEDDTEDAVTWDLVEAACAEAVKKLKGRRQELQDVIDVYDAAASLPAEIRPFCDECNKYIPWEDVVDGYHKDCPSGAPYKNLVRGGRIMVADDNLRALIMELLEYRQGRAPR